MPDFLRNKIKTVVLTGFAAVLLLQNQSAGNALFQMTQDDEPRSLNVVRQQDGQLDATAIQNNLQKIAGLIAPTLSATDGGADIGEEEYDTTSQMTPATSSDGTHNWLLLIGIDKYAQLSKLKNCVSDLKAMRDILTEYYAFDREHVLELFDEQATRENIIREFEELARKVRPSDNVLIYYEGHGIYNRTFKRGYWLPVDAGTESTAQYLPNSDLQAFIGAIRSRSTLVISDACFSGTLFPGNEKSVPFRPDLSYIQQVTRPKARQILTSGGNEPVAGGWMFLDQHSLFAHYLINQLERNAEKVLAASSLFLQVKTPVSNKGFQTPQYRTIKDTGDEGGEFVFVRK
jgi:hypothetical protein